jgi:hypothetical protein
MAKALSDCCGVKKLVWLLFKIDMLHVVGRVTQKSLTQPAKFLHRIGGEKPQIGVASRSLTARAWKQLLPMGRNRVGRRFGGVDNLHIGRRYAMEQRLEQGIVRAPQYQNIGVMKAVSERLPEIDAGDLLGNWVVHPAFFD